MELIEIARRTARLGQQEDALRAYALVLNSDAAPEEQMEAAVYTLESGGDYKLAYTTFVGLYNAGYFREQIVPLMREAFYEPNVEPLRERYEHNVRLLKKYPYLFRKDFPAFDELPLFFIPYDDAGGYVPFDQRSREFLGFVNVADTVVSRNFFRDLDKPILADDVYSQYELEYLVDNVRPSEWIGRENHIYLHYTDWTVFCAWLAVLNMKPLLEGEKIVLLFGDERAEYPIDFKKRFGIDYDKCPLRPLHIREINRLIWHTQFSSHNGGDFFNEVMDGHPNLLMENSIMFDSIRSGVEHVRKILSKAKQAQQAIKELSKEFTPRIAQELYSLKNPTDKDILVAYYLGFRRCTEALDLRSRIAPAVFFQPHFPKINFHLRAGESGVSLLLSDELEQIRTSPIIQGFRYIKTFTPLRRFTTSHAATVRRMFNAISDLSLDEEYRDTLVVTDAVSERILNRSFLRDPDDRLYRDSVIVRFEDGKLNPRATFSRLAAFLDLPYTESMTRCTLFGQRDPKQFSDNVRGFDPATVYNTYDEYANDNERKYIEFFLRDAYRFYGYSYKYYDGEPVDLNRVRDWVSGFDTINHYMRITYQKVYKNALESAFLKNTRNIGIIEGALEQKECDLLNDFMERSDELRIQNSEILLRGLRFVNRRGQPLEFTPMLEPDPDLLEQPLYH